MLTLPILLCQQDISRLLAHDDFEIFDPVPSVHHLSQIVQQRQPDIILMDIKNLNPSFTIAREIKVKSPSIKIVIVAPRLTRETLSRTIRTGMDGFLHLRIDQDTLVSNIQAICKGRLIFNEAILKLVFADICSKNHNENNNNQNFSEIESKILDQIAAGQSYTEIGDILEIPLQMLLSHKHKIMHKLGFTDSAELVRYALKHKIISVQ